MKNSTISNILCVGAMRDEVVPLAKMVSPHADTVPRGKPLHIQYKGKNIYFFITGIGMKNVRKRLPAIENIVPSLDLVIFMGVCGALDAAFKIGDIIVPEYVVKQSHPPLHIADAESIPLHNTVGNKNIYRGTKLLTTDTFISRPEKKKIKNAQPEIHALDMESYDGVSFFQTKGIPVCVIKSVSDSFHCRLPKTQFLIENYNQKNWGIWFKNICMHPGETLKSVMLHFHVRHAISNNICFVRSVIEGLS